jgi:hypothetical protein
MPGNRIIIIEGFQGALPGTAKRAGVIDLCRCKFSTAGDASQKFQPAHFNPSDNRPLGFSILLIGLYVRPLADSKKTLRKKGLVSQQKKGG